jgi:pyruvate/2-oxoglutarate dehydrogenase complex dihydrolipoamide dehydrogenase (E3) component/uncharacterized membrane protein YdjX (TVP38/TMEM64 family)
VKKLVVIILLAAAFAAFYAFGLDQYLTLNGIKGAVAASQEVFHEKPVMVIGLFFAIYVIATAASFPGAALLTLAAGALFGTAVGTVVVSFASTIGATLAFLASRYVLRDSIESKFGQRLKAINDGLERDGAFYLFTLRMVPAVPFFVVNLVMGLTRIRTWTYAWVSQVGMLLGTMVYVNAGTQLARLDSASGIFTPAVLGSFALLGIAPWIAKSVITVIRRRKVYRGYQRPKRYDRNLIVIGAGSAGLVSAYIAAQVRAKVTLVEARRMGGDCLNTGCVPSKALIKSARVAHVMRHADRYGLAPMEPRVPFRQTIARIMEVIAAIEPHDGVERYTSLGVEVLMGHATVIDPWTVEIALNEGGSRRLTARSIIIAAGAEPCLPPLAGIEDVGYLTSDTMWDAFAGMDEAPRRVVLLGGGPIGCEIAQSLARLGSSVTLVEMKDQLLKREDPDVADVARRALESSGVTVMTGTRARSVRSEGGTTHLVVERNGDEVQLACEALIVATGRKARLTGYGLEALGIDTERTVVTDEFLATSLPNIFAAGDVAGPYQFTHTASHQAWYASVNALFGQVRKFKADYRVIPAVTFLDPEIARVGINEREAEAQGLAYEVTRYDLDDFDRAIAEAETSGFVKVITAKGKDTILGATIVGHHAGELLAEYTLAMKHKLGLTKILGTIHPYPTMAEANKFAAGEWKKARKPERLLAFVERYHAWRRG